LTIVCFDAFSRSTAHKQRSKLARKLYRGLQKICDGLSAEKIDGFEQVIRENLGLGRPERVQLIFGLMA
jgi:hypothetical protein